jgi:hypothetical protein
VGFFGNFVYSDGNWSDVISGSVYLSVEVHDSDIATVAYAPADTAQGLFYLGFQPRDYFEDPNASAPVDVDGQATGITTWAKQVLGTEVAPEDVRPLLAEPGVAEPEDDFVEVTVVRLFSLLNLPIPAAFPETA